MTTDIPQAPAKSEKPQTQIENLWEKQEDKKNFAKEALQQRFNLNETEFQEIWSDPEMAGLSYYACKIYKIAEIQGFKPVEEEKTIENPEETFEQMRKDAVAFLDGKITEQATMLSDALTQGRVTKISVIDERPILNTPGSVNNVIGSIERSLKNQEAFEDHMQKVRDGNLSPDL